MSDCVASLAREYLLPLARDYLLPLARDNVFPVLKETVNTIRRVPKEVAEMKGDLESIEDFINDAVRMAEAEEDHTRDGIKTRVKQLREASFLIEDVIDEYSICEGQNSRDPAHFIKTMMLRFQIACNISKIKAQVDRVRREGEEGGFQIQPSARNQNTTLNNLREAPLHLVEAEVVGFEVPRDILIRWLVEGRKERTVISLVGQGGQGKTTLAKKVYDTVTQKVIDPFRCHARVTVSKIYNVDALFRDMLLQFYQESNRDPPQDISAMEGEPLREKVATYLQDKRYIVLFDDVWDTNIWDEIEFAFIDNKKGSRILITSRNKDVAEFFKRSSLVQKHELKPLSPEKSLELFYKKAFFDLDACPDNLLDISDRIVKKCEGLPLAIVAIGGLLSRKDRDPFQWERFSETLNYELDQSSHLSVITKILGFSYHDLPFHLKWCFLYFGIYPEGYKIKTDRLTRQWIAEGFVQNERGKTSEEIAEQYLTELIQRNLVQVSSLASDDKPRTCHVHNLVRQMILGKIQDLSFCHSACEIEENRPPVFSGMVRRLAIATTFNKWMASAETSNIRSLHVFKNEDLPDSYVTRIPSAHKLLKVLDLEDVPLYHHVPNDLGNLFLLRYLSFRNTKIKTLPGSIGMLHNLETLDLRKTLVREMPREINMLTKLRHLLAYDASKGVGFGIQLKNGIGDIESLQTLREVEADHGGIELIKELERLTKLRMLGLTNVKGEYTSALCSSINNKQHLEKLYITAVNGKEVIDLHHHVSAPHLRKLRLTGKLHRFPYWVRNLNLLVKLSLSNSMLTDDPLASLKDLTNLQYLSILYKAYEGESLHFPDGGFGKLKQLVLRRLYNFNSISIGVGALCLLEKLKLVHIPELYEVPSDVYDLPKLQNFYIVNMPEFEQNIDHDIGQFRWTIEQVPFVNIVEKTWQA